MYVLKRVGGWTGTHVRPGIHSPNSIYTYIHMQMLQCVCAQYILAVERLKQAGMAQPLRTVHLSFVPDEEVWG